MKIFMIATALAATFAIAPAIAADVGVSISIGQPGFYGRLDIGDYPTPQVIYRQPRIIERVTIERPPVYLRVPPGHRKNWKKHCREYNACGERVYFVQNNWYQQQYVPRYREQQREYREQRGNDRQREGDHQNNRGGNSKGKSDHDRD